MCTFYVIQAIKKIGNLTVCMTVLELGCYLFVYCVVSGQWDRTRRERRLLEFKWWTPTHQEGLVAFFTFQKQGLPFNIAGGKYNALFVCNDLLKYLLKQIH